MRSRAKACRVIWPLALSAGKSHGDAAAPAPLRRGARDRRPSPRGRARTAARGAPCRPCRARSISGSFVPRRRLRQAQDLRHAQARGVDELDQAGHARGGEPLAQRAFRKRPGPRAPSRSALDFLDRQHLGQRAARGAGLRSPASDRRAAALRHRDACGTGGSRTAGARARRRFSAARRPRGEIGAHVGSARPSARRCPLAKMRLIVGEIAPIGFDRVGARAALGGERLEEADDERRPRALSFAGLRQRDRLRDLARRDLDEIRERIQAAINEAGQHGDRRSRKRIRLGKARSREMPLRAWLAFYSSSNKLDCGRSRCGSARPRWRKACEVSSRPRGVRCTKPCWMR